MNYYHFKKPKKSRSVIKTIAVILLIVFVVFNFVIYISKPPVKGDTPQFNEKLLDGSSVSLEQYAGQPLIIYFWSTWCPTCKYESSVMEELSKDYQVLSICVYSGANKQVKEFMDKKGYSFPVINDFNEHIRSMFKVKGLPAIFILNSKGEIVFSEVGITTGIGIKIRMFFTE